MAAILPYAVQMTKLKVVYQKFLERGHTYMEVDSMHSAIAVSYTHLTLPTKRIV